MPQRWGKIKARVPRKNKESGREKAKSLFVCRVLTCGGGAASEGRRLSELRLFFLTVAAATVAAAELFAQPTMKPMEPTFVADSSACGVPTDFTILFRQNI